MLDEVILNKIETFYNSYKDKIYAIYLTGSNILPIEGLKPHDYDIRVIVNDQETIDSIQNELGGHKLFTDNSYIDLLFMIKSDIKDGKYLNEYWDYENYYVNNSTPLFGKKIKFPSLIEKDKKKALKNLKEFRNFIYTICQKNTNSYEYRSSKILYHLMFATFIILNNSYAKFDDIQEYLISSAHNGSLTKAEVLAFIARFDELYRKVVGKE